jgi:hypothetical protein
MLYGAAAGGDVPAASGTMSRVLSLRTTKSAGSLFNFNAEDPQELLATAFDLPSMRGVPETLASPRTKMRRAAGMSTAMAERPAYVRRPPLSHPGFWTPPLVGSSSFLLNRSTVRAADDTGQ